MEDMLDRFFQLQESGGLRVVVIADTAGRLDRQFLNLGSLLAG